MADETSLKLRTTSDPANLAPTRHRIEAFCAHQQMNPEACDLIGLCVNEAMANVHRHAYGGADDQPIEVLAERVQRGVRVSIRDWGNGHTPATLPDVKIDPLRPGGLGLICLKQYMDVVQFSPQPDGMLLIIEKDRT